MKITVSVPFHTVGCLHKDPSSDCAQQFSIRNNTVYVTHGEKYIDRDTGPDRYLCTLICSDNPDHEEGKWLVFMKSHQNSICRVNCVY